MSKTDTNTMESRIKPEQVLFEWQEKSRPFKKFSREFFINLAAAAVLFSLILLLIDGLIPVVLVGALFFMFYIFSTVEPTLVTYQITTYGIKYGQHRTEWFELGRYKFIERMGSDILVIETASAPWRMELVVDSKKKTQIEEVISKFLYKNDEPDTYFEKASQWVASKLNY